MIDEKPLRSGISPRLPELGQYLANILFYPHPPIQFFVPSLVQRRGQLGDPFRISDWGITRPGRSDFRAEEVRLHSDLDNI